VNHKEDACARLAGRGYTIAEIASRMKLGRRQVQRYVNTPEARALAREIREQIDPDATDVLRELLHSRSESIRLQAARTLLLTPVPAEADLDAEDDGSPRITVTARPEDK
jgi:hypothetical protein